MPKVYFRFYEELNDFLSSCQHKHEFEYHIRQGESVKHAIEACGVPHTEVDLILVNGVSVDFKCSINAGDRISVYPVFETIDISPVLKLRNKPLRDSRFIADVHLGGLARYLRMLGFDTLFGHEYSDELIAEISSRDRRIVLTKDRDLLMHRIIEHGRYIRAKEVREQLIELVEHLDLYRAFSPFSRCIECNTSLVAIDKSRIKSRLSLTTWRSYEDFSICNSCDQVFWQGSHYNRMNQFIADTFANEVIHQ